MENEVFRRLCQKERTLLVAIGRWTSITIQRHGENSMPLYGYCFFF